jgi:hypothetical protein
MVLVLVVFHLSALSCPLVWPILLPCSCNIWVHLLGAYQQACCWDHLWNSYFSMFEDIHIGHLALMLETCLNHLCVITKYVFWMLEVTFSLWFMCNCWKMSPWIQEEFSLFPRESSGIGHACVDYSWDDRLLPPSSWKFPICTTSHWLIYSRTRKFQDLDYLLSRSPNKDPVVPLQ